MPWYLRQKKSSATYRVNARAKVRLACSTTGRSIIFPSSGTKLLIAARRSDADNDLQHGGACLGDHRRACRRCRAGWRRLRAPARQGAQAAIDTIVVRHRRGDSGVAGPPVRFVQIRPLHPISTEVGPCKSASPRVSSQSGSPQIASVCWWHTGLGRPSRRCGF